MPDKPSKEFHAFTSLMDRLLTVPKSAIHEKMAAHRERSATNPNKRGPKPKAAHPTASGPGSTRKKKSR